jgi:hypothetical protein
MVLVARLSDLKDVEHWKLSPRGHVGSTSITRVVVMHHISVCMPVKNEVSVAAMRTSTESVMVATVTPDERRNQDNGRGNPSGDP